MWGTGYALGGFLAVLYWALLIVPMDRSHRKRKLALTRKRIRRRIAYKLVHLFEPKQQLEVSELAELYPIRGKVDGWYFRIEQPNQDHWIVKGSDLYGRKLLDRGKHPEHLLIEVIAQAKEVNRQLALLENN